MEGCFLCGKLTEVLEAKSKSFERVSSFRKGAQCVVMAGVLIKEGVDAYTGYRVEHLPEDGRRNVDVACLCPH